jgi:hypothetical protein
MGVRAALLLVLAGCADESAPLAATTSAGSASPAQTSPSAVPTATAGIPSLVRFRIVDLASGRPIPCRLTFTGVQGTRDPAFSEGDLPQLGDGWMGAYNRIFSRSGEGDLVLPTGRYELLVTRGVEWSAYRTEVHVTEAGTSVEGALEHVVETAGWASVDLHVHAEASFDSRVPMGARVHQFVADGVDHIVSTDHNVVSDYGPIVRELGLEELLGTTTGDEITTAYDGHFGAFPLPIDASAPKGGAIATKGRTAKEIFRDVRRRAPDAVIDVHHPRFDRGLGYFSSGELNPITLQSRRRGFSLEFDAIELLNGYQDPDRVFFEQAFSDWLALLEAGRVYTATGNSDSHHLRFNLGGYPRNYVRVDDDAPRAVTGAQLARGVKARHAFFTTGPLVDVTLAGGGIGDTFRVSPGTVKVPLRVRAAPWIDVDRVNVYVDGDMRQTIPIPASREVVRFDGTLDLEVRRRTFLVLRVEGDTPLPGFSQGPHSQGPHSQGADYRILPIAVTNPLFFDPR